MWKDRPPPAGIDIVARPKRRDQQSERWDRPKQADDRQHDIDE
jgi:hypothetical protein